MTNQRTRHEKGVTLTPTDLTAEDLNRNGDLAVDSTDSKLKVRLSGDTKEVITDDQAQTLTNKTIDVDNNTVSNIETDNLKTGVLNTDVNLTGATDTQIPSALAVKTLADTKVAGPASSTSNALARYNGTSGKLVKDSSAILDDSGNLTLNNVFLTDSSINPLNAAETIALNSSTGMMTGGLLSINGGDNTKFDLAAGEAVIVDNTNPTAIIRKRVSFGPFTAQTVTFRLTHPVSYIYIDSLGAIVQTNTFPTPEERRQYIFIGRLNHSTNTNIRFANSFPDILLSPLSQQYDFYDSLGPFNISGNQFSPNATDLRLNKSLGRLFVRAANYATNNQNPSVATVAAQTQSTFSYATQTLTAATTQNVDPVNYDVGGTITAIPGGAGTATIQRIYLFRDGEVRVHYGQNTYANLSEALQAISTETFTINAAIPGFGVLVGYIVLQKNLTSWSETTRYRFVNAARFDQGAGGSASGTTNLQQAYNNSLTPQITTDSTLGALDIRRGSAADTDNVFRVQNGAGVSHFSVNGNGLTSTAILALETATDASTTGSNATLGAFTTGIIRLTNNLLTSLANIPAGTQGQLLTLINRSGVSFSVVDESLAVGTAANRIFTGTGASVTLAANSSIDLKYDATSARWQVVGGTGSGSGAAVVSDRYTDISTIGQTVINFPFTITQSTTEKNALQLYIDGQILTEGASKDFQFTSISGGASSQVTLNAPIAAGLNITAIKVGGYNNTQVQVPSQINYVANNNAETDTTGWSAYDDGASDTPTDGTGGSPTLTITRTTTSPLRGVGSFLITKNTTNQRGQGVSYDISVDLADRGKVLQGYFDYQIASGTFADNDLRVWIYDVTNATLIQPAPYLLKNSGITERFNFEFQTAINSSAYRLIIHNVNTSLSAGYTFKFDNVNLGPTAKLYGSAETDWVSFTPTWTSSGTQPAIGNGGLTGRWRKVGDSAEVRVFINMGSTTTYGTGNYRIGFPTIGVIDVSKLANNGTSNTLGSGYFVNSSVNNNIGHVYPDSSTTVGVTFTGSTNLWGASVPFVWANGNSLQMEFRIPIVGWSSSVVMSQDADTRVVAARATNSGTVATSGAITPLVFSTIETDTHGAYNSSTGIYTVQVPGYYRVVASFTPTAATSSTIDLFTNLILQKNGATYASIANFIPQSTNSTTKAVKGTTITDYLTAGTQLRVALDNPNPTVTGVNNSTGTWVSFERLSGPAQIAASETVSASYSTAVGQSIPNTVITTVLYGTKEHDSHNAYNTSTGTYTVPISGKYSISASVCYTNFGPGTAGNLTNIWINKNGSSIKRGLVAIQQTATGVFTNPQTTALSVQLLAGDTITIGTSHDESTAKLLLGNAALNHFSIVRTGNY